MPWWFRGSRRPRVRGSRGRRGARGRSAAGRAGAAARRRTTRRWTRGRRSGPRARARPVRAAHRGTAPATTGRPQLVMPAAAESEREQAGRLRPARFVAAVVEASVRSDAIQPRSQRPPVESVEGAPCRHQHLLEHVFGVVHRTERAIAVHEQLAAVAARRDPRTLRRHRSGRDPGATRPRSPVPARRPTSRR